MPEYITDKNGVKKIKSNQVDNHKKPSFQRVPEHVRKVFEDVTENGKSVSGAMVDHGYAQHTANRLSIKNTKSWQYLLDTRLSDDALSSAHSDILTQTKDLTNRMRAVDLGYKLKRKYEDTEQGSVEVNITFNGSA